MDLPDKPGAAGDADLVRIHSPYKEKLMAIWGADVEQLRQLGKNLQQGADVIESQRNSLTALLDNTQWMGPDADKFKEQWRGEHTNKLNQVADALREAGNRAKQNAEQQFQASHG
jgi:Proteins of 100 residues with WXG